RLPEQAVRRRPSHPALGARRRDESRQPRDALPAPSPARARGRLRRREPAARPVTLPRLLGAAASRYATPVARLVPRATAPQPVAPNRWSDVPERRGGSAGSRSRGGGDARGALALAGDALADGGDEACLVAVPVCLSQLVLVEGADPLQQLELVAQVRPHHLRPVRGDREGDSVLDEGAEGLANGVLVRQGPREQVRGGADLEHDLGLAQGGHQLRLACGQDAVADPVGAKDLDHLAELGGGVLFALLADVDRDPEAGGARLLDERLQLAIRV